MDERVAALFFGWGRRNMHLREFVRLIRVPSLSATVVPLLLGAVAGLESFRRLDISLWLDMFFVALLMQIGANIFNEHGDFVKGVDTRPSHGFAGSIVRGAMSPREVLLTAVGVDVTASLLAIPLVIARGYVVLLAGLFGAAISVIYSEGSHPLSGTPFGEVAVGLTMGVLEVISSEFVASGGVSGLAFALSAPISLLVASILVSNNIRDLEKDKASGRRTLEVILGDSLSPFLFYFTLFSAYGLSIMNFGIMGVRGLLLPLVSLPFALWFSLRLDQDGWKLGVEYSSAIYLVFGLLLITGVLA